MKIALTGSTGRLGGLILKQLLFRCRAQDLILSVRQPRAAAVVLTEEGHENRTYELTPLRCWDLDDLARSISEASGRKAVLRTDPDNPNGIYRMLPYSDMHSVSQDLVRLAGQPLRSVQDEVQDLFG